jgi:TrmH family RNA methyltransferase
VGDLRVVNPYDPAFREAVSAVGGAHVLQSARLFGTLAEAVADCTLVVGTAAGEHREIPGLESLDAGMVRVREHAGRVALLFGSEKFGLSNDDLSFCHAILRIPTTPATPSMNLSQAVAVCLYEFVRGKQEPRLARSNEAAHRTGIEGAEAEQLTHMLLETLEESGYTNRIVALSTERKIRRWVRRTRIGARDVRLMLGILRQILWKIRSAK